MIEMKEGVFMRILIVDDEEPARSELNYEIEKILQEAVIEEASSGGEALQMAVQKKYDVVFVDVQMTDIEGTVIARTLKKIDSEVQIIMATAYEDYAVEAFDIDVTDYILKPFDPSRVKRALERSEQNIKRETNFQGEGNHRIAVMADKKNIIIDIRKIIYIETEQRNCLIHTKREQYKVSQSIGWFEQKLSPRGFFRCHKGILINLNYVTEIVTSFHNAVSVKMEGMGDLEIPVSRNKIHELKQLFSA